MKIWHYLCWLYNVKYIENKSLRCSGIRLRASPRKLSLAYLRHNFFNVISECRRISFTMAFCGTGTANVTDLWSMDGGGEMTMPRVDASPTDATAARPSSDPTPGTSRPQQLSKEEHDIFNADFIFPDDCSSTYTNEESSSLVFQHSTG